MSGIPAQRGGPVLPLGRAAARLALLRLQRGQCAVCRAEAGLVADHDHVTGLLRGLLCRACNVAEGKIGSAFTSHDPSPQLAAYLANPPAACLGYTWAMPDRLTIPIELAIEALVAVELPPLDG